MKSILNDICYLLLYTSIGNRILGLLVDVAWVYGYTKGRIMRFYRRIAK
jgi:hypothetical protein